MTKLQIMGAWHHWRRVNLLLILLLRFDWGNNCLGLILVFCFLRSGRCDTHRWPKGVGFKIWSWMPVAGILNYMMTPSRWVPGMFSWLIIFTPMIHEMLKSIKGSRTFLAIFWCWFCLESCDDVAAIQLRSSHPVSGLFGYIRLTLNLYPLKDFCLSILM